MNRSPPWWVYVGAPFVITSGVRIILEFLGRTPEGSGQAAAVVGTTAGAVVVVGWIAIAVFDGWLLWQGRRLGRGAVAAVVEATPSVVFVLAESVGVTALRRVAGRTFRQWRLVVGEEGLQFWIGRQNPVKLHTVSWNEIATIEVATASDFFAVRPAVIVGLAASHTGRDIEVVPYRFAWGLPFQRRRRAERLADIIRRGHARVLAA